jgi:hypothetical protein
MIAHDFFMRCDLMMLLVNGLCVTLIPYLGSVDIMVVAGGINLHL